MNGDLPYDDDQPAMAGGDEPVEVTDDDFDRMLQEMEDEIGDMPSFDDSGDDDEVDEASEDSVITSDGESGDGESADESLDLATADDEDEFVPEQPSAIAEVTLGAEDSLSISYSVQVAAGDGSFVDCESKGLLAGAREYKVTVLDDFTFGFDSTRCRYEVLLDPNSVDSGLKDVEPGSECAIDLDDDGRLSLAKPAGMRLAIHRIARNADGSQALTPVASVGPESAEAVPIPLIRSAQGDVAEYMLGVGLADCEPPSYAFSVYMAVKLA
jgi:hypothetical protein